MPGQGRRRRDRDKRGFHETPEEVTRALLQHESFKGPILEPACGKGAIARVLFDAGYIVSAQDLYDYGYGGHGWDFLKERERPDNIITNPPFEIYDDFLNHALKLSKRKVAVVARLGFLGGQERFQCLWNVNPPTRIIMKVKRVSMSDPVMRRGKLHRPKAVDYVWLVWNKADRSGKTEFIWTP